MKPAFDSELPADGIGPDVEAEAEASRAAGLVARAHVARAAFIGGVVAALLAGAVGLLRRRRRPTARRIARRRDEARRSLLREASSRLVLGAAGVLGARLASDLALPILEQRLAAARHLAEHDREDVEPSPRSERRSRATPEPEVAREAGRAGRRRHA